MVEIGQGVISGLVALLLVALISSTILTIQETKELSFPTGFASSDTGFVNLSINITLAIAVDPLNSSVVFGACAPAAATSYWCATNDTAICSGNTSEGNCSGDTTTPQFIRVDNVGSIDANVTIMSECNASSFIGGTNPLFQYIVTHCNGTGVPNWENFSSSASTEGCTNLSALGGAMRLYANITIPNNAVGGSGVCASQSDITFTAVQAS